MYIVICGFFATQAKKSATAWKISNELQWNSVLGSSKICWSILPTDSIFHFSLSSQKNLYLCIFPVCLLYISSLGDKVIYSCLVLNLFSSFRYSLMASFVFCLFFNSLEISSLFSAYISRSQVSYFCCLSRNKECALCNITFLFSSPSPHFLIVKHS